MHGFLLIGCTSTPRINNRFSVFPPRCICAIMQFVQTAQAVVLRAALDFSPFLVQIFSRSVLTMF